MRKQKQELRTVEKELMEDLELIVASIAKLENNKPENWKKSINAAIFQKSKTERDLSKVREQIKLEYTELDQYLIITDLMINNTIEEYFYFNIWTHPDMVSALEDLRLNGVQCLSKYSENIRKWMVIFNSKKYRNNKQKLEDEFIENHKMWVHEDLIPVQPGQDHFENPFSFRSCIEQRGHTTVKKLQDMLDSLSEWTLETLIEKFDIFHYSSQKQEMERIMERR